MIGKRFGGEHENREGSELGDDSVRDVRRGDADCGIVGKPADAVGIYAGDCARRAVRGRDADRGGRPVDLRMGVRP